MPPWEHFVSEGKYSKYIFSTAQETSVAPQCLGFTMAPCGDWAFLGYNYPWWLSGNCLRSDWNSGLIMQRERDWRLYDGAGVCFDWALKNPNILASHSTPSITWHQFSIPSLSPALHLLKRSVLGTLLSSLSTKLIRAVPPLCSLSSCCPSQQCPWHWPKEPLISLCCYIYH